MGQISLEQAGEEQAEAEQAGQGILESFVAYIVQRKMVRRAARVPEAPRPLCSLGCLRRA
jgi:hypothetical protein